ncbi:MAG: hypothetical protein ACOCUZ_02815, partial [bacterium]
GGERKEDVHLTNAGNRAVGPVSVESASVQGPEGDSVLGARLRVEPDEIPTLNPGASVAVHLTLELPGILAPGEYATGIRVRSDLGDLHLPVSFVVREASAEDVAEVSFIDPPDAAVQGTVIRLPVSALDADGAPLEAAPLLWSTVPAGEGFVDGDHFVPYGAGTLDVVVRAGAQADTATLEVAPRNGGGSGDSGGGGGDGGIATLGTRRAVASPGRTTSDLWLHGDHAYTGTWGSTSAFPEPGNALFVWSVFDPDDPALVDSVLVDARVVNDVKVSADGSLALLTHEYSNDGLNGVTLLDLADPAHPTVIGRYTDGLAPGVHNAWIDGDFAYLVVDGAGGLRILDISTPSAPREVGRYYAGSSFLHDVYVRDGLAFLSHWNAGLVILDVGNGVAGGSPSSPTVVARMGDLGGETHNAWYWPDAGYVFVGEEDVGAPGMMRVVDVHRPTEPRLVATYRVPGDSPHNFWLDEEEGILYLAWYRNGVRALDVTGRLLGELDRQGREVAAGVLAPDSGWCATGPGPACAWAPQLHDGYLYVSDMRRGLVVSTPAP